MDREYSYDEDYDDDFEDSKSTASRRPSATTYSRGKSPYNSYSNYSQRSNGDRQRSRTRSPRTRSPSQSPVFRKTRKKPTSRQDSFASKKSAYAASRKSTGQKKQPKKGSSSSMSRGGTGPKLDSHLVQRILSAGRNKVHKLQNIVEELTREVEELQIQNKDLKRTQHKQERELVKLEVEEANLPTLLHRHSAEVKALRERLKKNQEVLRQKERDAKNQHSEITKLRQRVKNYEELAKDKKLKERADLTKKLHAVEKELEEKNKKLEELEKTIKLTDKARVREIRTHKEKYKQAQEALVKLEGEQQQLSNILKEKGKELDRRNIYHQNITRLAKKYPAEMLQPALPPPAPPSPRQRSITPEKPAKESPRNARRTPVFLTAARSDTSSVSHKEHSEAGLDEPEPAKSVHNSVQDDSLEKERWEAEIRRQVEEEVRKRKEEELRRSEEDQRVKEAEEARKRHEEALARERAKFEEESKRLQDERRRQEEERKREEEERIRQEELRRREEEDRLRREEEERARLREYQRSQEDEKEAERNRKKEELLARLRAIDENQGKPQQDVNANFLDNTDAKSDVNNKPKQLPIFLQSSARQEPKVESKPRSIKTDSDSSRHSSAKEYNFKASVENLHKGLPSHPSNESIKKTSEDLTFGSYKPSVENKSPPRRTSRRGELSFGSYNPTFGNNEDSKNTNEPVFGSGVKETSKDKDHLVFGSYNPSFTSPTEKRDNNASENGVFSPKNNANRRRPRVSGGVFGDDFFSGTDSPKSNSTKDNSLFGEDLFTPKKTLSGTGFGGLEDDSLLPRRKRRQAEKTVPAVGNALNDKIDDELEEFIL